MHVSQHVYECHTTAHGTAVLKGQLCSNGVSGKVLTLGPPTQCSIKGLEDFKNLREAKHEGYRKTMK